MSIPARWRSTQPSEWKNGRAQLAAAHDFQCLAAGFSFSHADREPGSFTFRRFSEYRYEHVVDSVSLTAHVRRITVGARMNRVSVSAQSGVTVEMPRPFGGEMGCVHHSLMSACWLESPSSR